MSTKFLSQHYIPERIPALNRAKSKSYVNNSTDFESDLDNKQNEIDE